MAELKELYRLATGNVQVDIVDIITKIKNAQSEEEKQELIGKILYIVPGGVGGAANNEFRSEFYKALHAESIHLDAYADKDGDVDKADYDAVKSGKLDITHDEKFDSDDLALVKRMSTVEIVEEDSDEAVDSDEPVEDGSDVETSDVEDTPEEVQK